MAFNNVPVNGWPQIKQLEELDAIAKQIENMPTFTNDDRAFLEDLPAYPSEDGTKVLTATTSSGETTLSYEKKSDLPADPQTDGVRVLTATTSNGNTTLSYEEAGGSTITTNTITGTTDANGTLTPVDSIDSDDYMVISAFSGGSKVCIPVVAQSDGTWRFRIFEGNMQPLDNTEVTVKFTLLAITSSNN